MASTTTNHNLPYPEGTDPVNVDGDIQALAEASDTAFTSQASDIDFRVGSTSYDYVEEITESAYAALSPPDDRTLYIVVED